MQLQKVLFGPPVQLRRACSFGNGVALSVLLNFNPTQDW
jgi:hypothetical protein